MSDLGIWPGGLPFSASANYFWPRLIALGPSGPDFVSGMHQALTEISRIRVRKRSGRAVKMANPCPKLDQASVRISGGPGCPHVHPPK